MILPPTTIVKNIDSKHLITLPEGTQYIIKSVSNIRSIVVNNKIFAQWNKDGLKNLPTLFQEQIEGSDVRVHVCHDKVFAVKILDKNQIDYRYAETFSLEVITIPEEIVEFCLAISHMENNPLIGIDLIETKDGYVFLESNPMPGWEWFYKNNLLVKNEICTSILLTA